MGVLKFGNMIVGGVVVETPTPEEPVKKKQESISVRIAKQTEEENLETHVKLTDGELERLVPKKSPYMMDLALGSE